MTKHTINHNGKLPLYKQIADNFIRDIEKGVLKKDTLLPSINNYHDEYSVGRDTIERSYKELKRRGYVVSVPAKGYYVKERKDNKLKILVIFNKLSSYKKLVYESIIAGLYDRASVDLRIHNYKTRCLNEILDDNISSYHYYVIMPHFLKSTSKSEYLNIIKIIPEGELVVLDKNLPEAGIKYISVFQDYKNDIYKALYSVSDLMNKYEKVAMIFPRESDYPVEIVEGTRQYCDENSKAFTILENSTDEPLTYGTLYLVITEPDLASLLKKSRASAYKPGKDIGIISFNDTDLKEVLDITVFTTDFIKMGRTTAELILNESHIQVPNPFYIIKRGSL